MLPIHIFLEKLFCLNQLGKQVAVYIKVPIHTPFAYVEGCTKLSDKKQNVNIKPSVKNLNFLK